MSEFQSSRELIDAGLAAVQGIRSDETLTSDEQETLVELDPTIQIVRQAIADEFAAEEAAAKRARDELKE